MADSLIKEKEKVVVERSVLIKEIDSLHPRYYSKVIDFIGYIKDTKEKDILSLEKAAEMASKEYKSDKELTSFCEIDSDDFYETR